MNVGLLLLGQLVFLFLWLGWLKRYFGRKAFIYWTLVFLAFFISVDIMESARGSEGLVGAGLFVLLFPFIAFSFFSLVLGAIFLVAKLVNYLLNRTGVVSRDMPVNSRTLFLVLITPVFLYILYFMGSLLFSRP